MNATHDTLKEIEPVRVREIETARRSKSRSKPIMENKAIDQKVTVIKGEPSF